MARKSIRAVLAGALALVLVAAAGIACGIWWQSGREHPSTDVPLSAVDIGFCQDMSTHHEQAILLSQTLAADVDPQVRSIADQIVRAQSAEIATMHGWLGLFDLPFTSTHPMAWMHHDDHADMAGMHHDPGKVGMPGMASVDEITQLGTLHGRDAEVRYLQLMIRHHQGGVDMATAANNLGLRSQIDRIAVEMISTQGNEIGMMTAMLRARGGEVLPYP